MAAMKPWIESRLDDPPQRAGGMVWPYESVVAVPKLSGKLRPKRSSAPAFANVVRLPTLPPKCVVKSPNRRVGLMSQRRKRSCRIRLRR